MGRNAEEYRAYMEVYRTTHKRQINKTSRAYKRRLKFETLVHYSGSVPKCACCGITDTDVLTIDHIDNNGAEHRKVAGLGSAFYAWLKHKVYPKGYQVLCFNCNIKKYFRQKEISDGED